MSGEPGDGRSLSPDQSVFLAQKYTNCSFFHVEFISFESALSAAVLVLESAKEGMQRAHDELTELENGRAHRSSGWEAESDVVLAESRGITADALAMTRGLATVLAAAALERLISDVGHGGSKDGLMPSLCRLLDGLRIESDERESGLDAVRPDAKARNEFARTALGSGWTADASACVYTRESSLDGIRVVAKVAKVLEQLFGSTETSTRRTTVKQ